MRNLFILFACCAMLPSLECFSLQASLIPSNRGNSQTFSSQRPRFSLSATQSFRLSRRQQALSGLKCQSDSVDTKLTDEMVLLMALKQLKQNELPEGSKVLVFGELRACMGRPPAPVVLIRPVSFRIHGSAGPARCAHAGQRCPVQNSCTGEPRLSQAKTSPALSPAVDGAGSEGNGYQKRSQLRCGRS
jgi:hypothetical protein